MVPTSVTGGALGGEEALCPTPQAGQDRARSGPPCTLGWRVLDWLAYELRRKFGKAFRVIGLIEDFVYSILISSSANAV